MSRLYKNNRVADAAKKPSDKWAGGFIFEGGVSLLDLLDFQDLLGFAKRV